MAIDEAVEIEVDGSPVYTIQAGPPSGQMIVLLHGASFAAETWRRLGTLDRLAEAGLRAIAADAPGYGDSPANESMDRDRWLDSLLEALGAAERRPVIVTPSMSGRLALPLVTTSQSQRLGGWVAVAPVGLDTYRDRLAAIRCPVLAIWGERDHVVPLSMQDLLVKSAPNARRIVLREARHPCYLDAPDKFHDELIRFVGAARARQD